jgi:leader peptidase (prepilin peptidase)/N-methyltransferase
MFLIFATGLGAIGGSFLNALSFRLGTGRSALRGRSKCMRCGHTLSALDLVPVLSWLFLRGRCRYCGTRISAQYPLVEIGAAVLGILCAVLYSDPLSFAFWFVVNLTLLFVLVYDLRHSIIPWGASGILAALAVLYIVATGAGDWAWYAGPILAAPLVLIFIFSRGRAMGLGDGALELSLGWLLGLSAGLTALMIAFWLGAVVGIALMLGQKRYTMRSELPFAPFLIAGAWVSLFLHVDLFSALSSLFL